MKRAIYPGSFDPITNGHIDVINRATNIFDTVIIGVIQNPEKSSFFSLEERIQLVKALFKQPNIQVEGFQGLLINFAKSKNVTTIIRGLRAISDFDYEFQMAITNRTLYPSLDTVFLMTESKYAYLSSSLVRQVALLDGEIDAFVPEIVKEALHKKRGSV